MKKILLALLLLAVLVPALALWTLLRPLPAGESAVLRIPYGASLHQAISILREENLISNSGIFSLIARSYAKFGKKHIYAGSYKFSGKQNHLQLLKAIFSGKQVYSERVTFPEGKTIWEFASIVQRRIETDSAEFVRLAFSDSLARAHGIEAGSVEGYLMPDTYNFYWRQSPRDVLNRLLNDQDKIWDEKFATQAAEKGKSRHEILTLASIIEAETPMPSERPRVAGVYKNRLERGIRLEADPTVQYALGGVRRKLYYRDLEVDSPYNTYRNTGLTPGPINSPSIASIEAALNPEENRFIYFVAKGDGSGGHTFSENFSAHQKAVQDYRDMKKTGK